MVCFKHWSYMLLALVLHLTLILHLSWWVHQNLLNYSMSNYPLCRYLNILDFPYTKKMDRTWLQPKSSSEYRTWGRKEHRHNNKCIYSSQLKKYKIWIIRTSYSLQILSKLIIFSSHHILELLLWILRRIISSSSIFWLIILIELASAHHLIYATLLLC